MHYLTVLTFLDLAALAWVAEQDALDALAGFPILQCPN